LTAPRRRHSRASCTQCSIHPPRFLACVSPAVVVASASLDLPPLGALAE
jgi:hypothetical protein